MRYAVASQVLTGVHGSMQRGAHRLHVGGAKRMKAGLPLPVKTRCRGGRSCWFHFAGAVGFTLRLCFSGLTVRWMFCSDMTMAHDRNCIPCVPKR
jgi:hypothetical protein